MYFFFQLPFDEDDFSYMNTVKHQVNLLNEWSDSSDSGVSGKVTAMKSSYSSYM